MAANISPIYSIVGATDSVANNNAGLVVGPTANTTTTGAGAMYKAFTAGANGSYVQKMRFRPVGTTAATVARIYISTSTATSNANTWLYDEITLPAVTVSNLAATSVFELPINVALDPNYLLYINFGTSTGTANNGFSVVTIAGDY